MGFLDSFCELATMGGKTSGVLVTLLFGVVCGVGVVVIKGNHIRILLAVAAILFGLVLPLIIGSRC